MKQADRITGAVLSIIALYVMYTAWGLELWTKGADSAPGPGMVSFVSGALLLLLSIALIVKSGKKEAEEGAKALFPKDSLKQFAVIAGAALGASLLSYFLGLIVSLGVMGGFLMYMMSEKKEPIKIIFVTICLPIVFYLIFKAGLDIQLPTGILGI